MAMSYVTPEEVADLVASGGSRRFAIIDVRDYDRVGGHIRGSLHVPSQEFDDKVSNLVERFKNHDVLVFHCMYSQQRGPSCAMRFARELSARAPSAKVQTAILKGGFINFFHKHKGNPALFEDLDAERWEDYDD
eukprot:tig00020610_g12077.t1